MAKLLTQDAFIERSKALHGYKYNYGNVKFVNTTTLVDLVCPIHGDFKQTPKLHLKGSGCNACGFDSMKLKTKKTVEQFIIDARMVHGDIYDYYNVKYVNAMLKVNITCKIHGDFAQKPNNHIDGKATCPHCAGNFKKDTEIFIQEAKLVHKESYDYSLVKYIGANKKIKIICKKHGMFTQLPSMHLNQKSGCPECAHSFPSDTKSFIENARKMHGDLYDYSKSDYVHSKAKLIIICKKHGEFLQPPNGHLRGNGCPNCQSSKGEQIIKKYLISRNVSFEEQKRFDDCKYKRRLPFDFFLPTYNTCVEFDGPLHFEVHPKFGGEAGYINRQTRDNIKNDYCKKNGINLVRIGYMDNIIKKLCGIFDER